jgi:hypothetical protein
VIFENRPGRRLRAPRNQHLSSSSFRSAYSSTEMRQYSSQNCVTAARTDSGGLHHPCTAIPTLGQRHLMGLVVECHVHRGVMRWPTRTTHLLDLHERLRRGVAYSPALSCGRPSQQKEITRTSGRACRNNVEPPTSRCSDRSASDGIGRTVVVVVADQMCRSEFSSGDASIVCQAAVASAARGGDRDGSRLRRSS